MIWLWIIGGIAFIALVAFITYAVGSSFDRQIEELRRK